MTEPTPIPVTHEALYSEITRLTQENAQLRLANLSLLAHIRSLQGEEPEKPKPAPRKRR